MKNKIKDFASKYLIILIFSFASNLLFAQSDSTEISQVLSVNDCIRVVLEENYQLKVQQNKQEVANNNATWGNAGALPSIDLVGGGDLRLENNYNTNTSGIKSSDINENNNSAAAAVQLSWSIFEGLKVQTTYQKLKEYTLMGEIATQMTIEDMVAKTVSAYYNIVRQNLRLQNLATTLDLTKERYEISKQRYELEDASLLEYQLAQVDYNTDNYEYLKQKEVLRSSFISLMKLMVYPSDSSLTIHNDSVELLPITVDSTFKKEVELSNLSLRYADMQTNISEKDLDIARSRLYPYIRFNTSYGYGSNWYDNNPIKHNHNLALNAGITVGINLFDGLNTRRAIKNAKLQIETDSLVRLDLKNDILAEFENVKHLYTNNIELIELQDKNIEIAASYFKSAQMRYSLGMISGVDLRDAQLNLLMAQERLSILEYETKLLEVSLFMLKGQVTNTYFNRKNDTNE